MTCGPSHRELCIDVEFICMISLSPKTLQRKTFPNIMATERTFIMIKPDGVQRGLVGDIIKRFEQKGFKLVAIRMMRPGRGHLEEHYADLSKRPFFPGLVQYMDSGPVVAMCWEGEGVVKTGRVMLGETNPRDSKPGTIRGDYCIQVSLCAVSQPSPNIASPARLAAT